MMNNSDVGQFNLFSVRGKMRILHMSWLAFLISFIIWFNHAPLLASIRDSLHLTEQQIKALLIINVALTIPARIIVGMLVDTFGPRRMYTVLLLISSGLCFGFALANTYERLALMRFLLGFSGAGFVIGIRLVSEWFPVKQLGLAEGIYGGWGNFGSAAAAISLPVLAVWIGGENGWRYATALTGGIALVYAVVFYFSVSDTPKGSTYFKPKRGGAMEVSSIGDFILYLISNIPMYAALGLLTWKLGPANLQMLSREISNLLYLALAGLYIFQVIRIYQINAQVFNSVVPEIDRYKFKQVAILNLAYLVTFGSELAVVSMLPLYFKDTFSLSLVEAGLIASIFAGLNLVMRPAGGLLSDKYGRKLSLVVIIAGLALGYFLMGKSAAGWSLYSAMAVTIFTSLFVNAGNGAVFGMIPLVKRRLTGQIAGMAGAYGNIGGVVFLTVLSFVSTQMFFYVISGVAVVTLVLVMIYLEEPKGHMAEVLPDGTVQMIEIA
ncbi:MAG: NarK family nitrate/nitrite MFS transporter [Gammaproteobacteria bacterium]|nr:NarK family nitrate/nitrite MFS transporter [Gammaproteobacteria bacterium]